MSAFPSSPVVIVIIQSFQESLVTANCSFYVRCKEMFYFLCSIFVYFSFFKPVESVLHLKSNMQIFYYLPSPYCYTLQPSFRVFQISTFVETSYAYIFKRISVSVCLMGNCMLLCQCFEGNKMKKASIFQCMTVPFCTDVKAPSDFKES